MTLPRLTRLYLLMGIAIMSGCATTPPVQQPENPQLEASAPETETGVLVPLRATSVLNCCTLEYPEEGWTLVTEPGGQTVTLSSNNDDVGVILERSGLSVALTPEEINEVFATIEADIIRERHPRAGQFDTAVSRNVEGPFVVTDYHVPGDTSAALRKRQYSFPRGAALYRLIFTVPETIFAVYETIFERIAASFRTMN